MFGSLRFLLSFAVILSHLSGSEYALHFGYYAVRAFFVISGFLMTAALNEIYQSIQGESTWVGWPCVFVRLTFCNLRCNYCDTEYAFYDGNKRTLGEILDAGLKEIQKQHADVIGHYSCRGLVAG